MNKFIVFTALLATLVAGSNGQYFAASHGVEFPRYGKRSDSSQETQGSNENSKPNLNSLIQKSFSKTRLQKIPKEKLNDYQTRQLIIEYLFKNINEND